MGLPVPYSIGTVISMFGAFTVGWVFHQLIQGSVSPTSPVTVGGLVTGGVMIFTGYRLGQRFEPSHFVSGHSDDDEHTFDASLSPIEDPSSDEHQDGGNDTR